MHRSGWRRIGVCSKTRWGFPWACGGFQSRKNRGSGNADAGFVIESANHLAMSYILAGFMQRQLGPSFEDDGLGSGSVSWESFQDRHAAAGEEVKKNNDVPQRS